MMTNHIVHLQKYSSLVKLEQQRKQHHLKLVAEYLICFGGNMYASVGKYWGIKPEFTERSSMFLVHHDEMFDLWKDAFSPTFPFFPGPGHTE